MWISLALAALVYIALLVLGGIGLSRMAKKEHKKYAFLGFFPIVHTWYAGYIAGEAKFFGQKMKRAGLYAALLEGLYIAVLAMETFTEFLMYLHPTEQTVLNAYGQEVRRIGVNVGEIPPALRWLFEPQGQIWMYVIDAVLFLALIAFLVTIYLALFRKYYARGPMLMTLLSTLLPFRGVTTFAVSNNDPVDYNAYLRKRMEAMRRPPYGPAGPYNGQNGPYGGPNGPYGGPNGPYNGQGGYGGQNEDPFSDFGPNSGSGTSGTGSGTNGGSNTGSGGGNPPDNGNPFSDFD